MQLTHVLVISFVLFSVLSIFFFVQHERQMLQSSPAGASTSQGGGGVGDRLSKSDILKTFFSKAKLRSRDSPDPEASFTDGLAAALAGKDSVDGGDALHNTAENERNTDSTAFPATDAASNSIETLIRKNDIDTAASPAAFLATRVTAFREPLGRNTTATTEEQSNEGTAASSLSPPPAHHDLYDPQKRQNSTYNNNYNNNNNSTKRNTLPLHDVMVALNWTAEWEPFFYRNGYSKFFNLSIDETALEARKAALEEGRPVCIPLKLREMMSALSWNAEWKEKFKELGYVERDLERAVKVAKAVSFGSHDSSTTAAPTQIAVSAAGGKRAGDSERVSEQKRHEDSSKDAASSFAKSISKAFGGIESTAEQEEEQAAAGSEDRTPQVVGNKADVSLVGGNENPNPEEKKGTLMCNGQMRDSEIIYWKVVPGDDTYESPITPHHDNHHDRYLTFEYDNGGWNNVRMGLECVIVVAHAMGRTLVIPPQQHLYLLGKTHKDPHDTEAHDEMGFEDFFDIDVLQSHKGYHVIHMEHFLEKEGVTGGLHGVLPPGNSSEIWGPKLWHYLDKNSDLSPEWMGKFLAMPAHPGDFNMTEAFSPPDVLERFNEFKGTREPFFYDGTLQKMHHIHIPGDQHHRLLQHHYAFVFFADPEMQSFYRRFVRDYMRYKDDIQCAGADLLAAVREEARVVAPHDNGDFYALHIRRGDFQFKEVKISASQIVENLHFPNGTPIIPPNSLVYVSTDDPDGVCLNCYVKRQPCTSYPAGQKPVGCQEDPSWNAFIEAGWKIRFLKDFMQRGMLAHVNPNKHGMVESIVCSRAKVFAGTYYSTFTGYIHRLRGYHGLGEATYYHAKKFLLSLQMEKSVGHGWPREWRAGWTDDEGEPI